MNQKTQTHCPLHHMTAPPSPFVCTFSTPSHFLDRSLSSLATLAPSLFLLAPEIDFLSIWKPSRTLGKRVRDTMADSASESDTDGAGSSSSSATPQSSCTSAAASNTTTTTTNAATKAQGVVISQSRLEELTNRLASLQQENKVLKIELETFKLKCKALQEENRDLRKASVTIVSQPVFMSL